MYIYLSKSFITIYNKYPLPLYLQYHINYGGVFCLRDELYSYISNFILQTKNTAIIYMRKISRSNIKIKEKKKKKKYRSKKNRFCAQTLLAFVWYLLILSRDYPTLRPMIDLLHQLLHQWK